MVNIVFLLVRNGMERSISLCFSFRFSETCGVSLLLHFKEILYASSCNI